MTKLIVFGVWMIALVILLSDLIEINTRKYKRTKDRRYSYFD